jgi:chromosome partitioning protein
MSRIIAITNQKGGVAKTTCSMNIAAGLAAMGKSVLLFDLDPQHNLTVSLGIEAHTLDKTIYDVLANCTPIDEVIIERSENFYLVPASLALSAADIELSSIAGREFLIKEAIGNMKYKYDFILFDCPPSLGLLTLNALTAANEVMIPVQTEYLALQGINMLLETIEVVKARLNPNIYISGIIPTRYDTRKNINKEVLSYLKETFGDLVFKSEIHDNVALAESVSFGKTIFEYSINSRGGVDFKNLAHEIVNM